MADQEIEVEKKAVKHLDNYLEKEPAPDSEVMNLLRERAAFAALTLGRLLSSDNDNIKLSAARDILDRTGWKPIERKDVTSGGMPISAQSALSDDQLMDVINGFLKRNAIDVPGTEVGRPEGNI